jgi:plasmid stability protein
MAKKTTVKRAGRGSDQFMVRLPDGMRKALAELAARNGRSMNAEIVHALAMYFENERQSVAVRTQLRGDLLADTRDRALLAKLYAAVGPETGGSTATKGFEEMVERLDRNLTEITRKLETGELVEMLKQQLKEERKIK